MTPAAPREPGLPLLPSQASFLHGHAPAMLNPHRWNLGKVFRLPRGVDADLARTAVEALWRHHEALRVRFAPLGDSWRQEVVPATAAVPFRHIDLSRQRDDEQRAAIERINVEVQHTLHLQAGPLVRFVHYHLGSQEPPRLFIALHHLVADGMAFSVLVNDLDRALLALIEGGTPALGRSAPYADCVAAVHEYANSEEVAGELTHWLGQARREARDLPVDAPSPGPDAVGAWTTASLDLDRSSSDALVRRLPAVTGLDVGTIVVAALAEVVTEWAGGPVCFRPIHHGRDLTRVGDGGVPVLPPRAWRTVGWFSFGGLVVLGPRTEPDTVRHLRHTAESMVAAPNHAAGLGLLRWLAPAGPHRAALTELWHQPGILINNLGNISRPAAAGGVLAPAEESAGRLADPLEQRDAAHVNVLVTDGSLCVDWDFDPLLRRPETISGVLEQVEKVLRSYAAEVAD